jgi:hypothetical protein
LMASSRSISNAMVVNNNQLVKPNAKGFKHA